MATYFVSTKFEFVCKIETDLTGEEYEYFINDISRPTLHRLNFFNPEEDGDFRRDTARLEVRKDSFAPIEAYNIELNNENSEFKVKFEGWIKIPTRSSDEIIDEYIKNKVPGKYRLEDVFVRNNWCAVVQQPDLIEFNYKKTKPKEVSFG